MIYDYSFIIFKHRLSKDDLGVVANARSCHWAGQTTGGRGMGRKGHGVLGN